MMTKEKIYQMPLAYAMKKIPAEQLAALISNRWFAAALLKSCKKQK